MEGRPAAQNAADWSSQTSNENGLEVGAVGVAGHLYTNAFRERRG